MGLVLMLEKGHLRRNAINHGRKISLCVENLPEEVTSRKKAVLSIIMYSIRGEKEIIS